MEQQPLIYSVTVEAKLPEFDSERLFVVNEKKYAQGELKRLEQKPGIAKVLRAAAAPMAKLLKPKDWRAYLKELDHYWVKLHDHMEDIAEGDVPLKFYVINNGPELDEKIEVTVHVHQGTIRPSKQAPERPERIDGDQHVPNWTPRQPVMGGFSRSKINVTPHTVTATFSQLEGHDSADLVHQILYVHGDEHTRFTYEIRSQRLGVIERGEVGFI
jgi:hypothetical protein